MKLSVVVVNWNTRDYLKECLEKVVDGVRDLAYEIIVVDNGSTDGSSEMVVSDFPSIRLLGNKENLGFPKAVNQGIRESSGDFVALINTDVFVFPDSLAQLFDYLERHPEVAAVGPQLVDRYGHLQYSAGFAPSPMTALRQLVGVHAFIGGRSRGVYARSRSTKKKLSVDWLSAACLLVRKDAIEDVGLMDESHFMYAEDTEYGLRLHDRGWKLHLLPWVRVLHLGGASSRDASENTVTQLLWLGGMFRIAAGRLSRPRYALFGGLLSAAYIERSFLIRMAQIFLKRDLEGIASAHDARIYAKTAIRLGFSNPQYASEFCSEIEARHQNGKKNT